jgi:hypothetical protein
LPDLTSGIDALLERFDAEAFDGVDKQFIRPLTQIEIGLGEIFNHIGDVVVGNGRTDQGS